jgi:cytidylate kinase
MANSRRPAPVRRDAIFLTISLSLARMARGQALLAARATRRRAVTMVVCARLTAGPDKEAFTVGFQVVTIAMTTGAGAERIGRLAAERLGFQYVSDEIIDRAAAHAGVSRQEVAEVERSPSLISRILNLLGGASVPEYTGPPLTPDEIDPSPSYRRLIQDVIREIAARRDVVILAHGASILLGGTPGVLRVLVTGSPGTRADRLAAELGHDARQASREIQHADRERKAFFKRFHNLDEELPTHYDLVVNTDVLAPEAAARLIAYAATDRSP